ncbi:oligosaccharide flippase family protein [Spiribacter halobius]|uniref:Uncharacterized protein n=1 Tax=Sediminicurvatus halobius TaxID=2182432 RepID=A0A2U2N137_9GAMM|nr:oligosaccharide flippase family protein [Spiribacter halobius]PWG62951.1 hypothetical protein DEM34_10145 [Spiribacter halobius]
MALAIRIYGVMMTLGLTVLLTRGLGASDYGRYAFIFAIITIASIPAQFGLPDLVIREISQARVRGSLQHVAGLTDWAHRFITVTSCLAIAAVISSLQLIDDAARVNFFAAAFAASLVPLLALGNLRGAMLRGWGYNLTGLVPEHAMRPTAFALALLVATVLAPERLSVLSVFAIQAGSMLFVLGVSIVLLWMMVPNTLSRCGNRNSKKVWSKSAFSLGSISGLLVLANTVDIVMLGVMSTSTQVGLYRLASMVSATVTLGLQTMNMFSLPYLAGYHASQDQASLTAAIRRTSQVAFFFAGAVALVLVIAGPQALTYVFGAEFSPAYPILGILIIGYLANAFFGPVASLLTMAGAETIVLGVTASGAALNAGLNLMLIPEFGAAGAAVASIISITGTKGCLFIAARQRLGVWCCPLPLPAVAPRPYKGE